MRRAEAAGAVACPGRGLEAWRRVERGRGRDTREEPGRGRQGARDSTLKATGCFRLGQRGGAWFAVRRGLGRRFGQHFGGRFCSGKGHADWE
jgi:hypothetical protein